ncbi:radical SAM family heme chaperone HemW [Hydrogenivirga sp.]
MVRGIYVHIPFCSYKCPYCDFTSVVKSPIDHHGYVDLLLKEAELYRDEPVKAETLYIGGGTPTLMRPELIGRLIDGLVKTFNLSSLKEITVECNPETYRYGEFKSLLGFGVNRLSVGVQSFTEKGLRSLGREHSVEDSVRAITDAREAGFDNLNVDLIYAFPGQTPEDILAEMGALEELKPEHVSAYMLTAYEDTPLGASVRRGGLSLPEEETLEGIYDTLWKSLKSLGYERYETSNWAKEGRECRHNLLYWTMEEFLGLGVSAWGFLKGKRYGNTKNIGSYTRSVSSGTRPVESVVILTEEELFEEEIMLKLRLKWGLRVEERKLIPEHLMSFFEESKGRLGIREEFALLSNEIITEVLLYNSHRNSTEVKNG